jgi:hypothetical protein
VADVHTNTGELIPPTGVLHVATGPSAAMLMIVDTDEGPTLYVGPAFTYYEFIEEGMPPHRLTDNEWWQRLSSEPWPAGPDWTASFRLPSRLAPESLRLPLD